MSAPNKYMIDVIASKVVDTLHNRGAGHCLQVAHLPLAMADAAAGLVFEQLTGSDAVALVQTTPTQPWHAKPTKVVELRNEVESTGGRLAIFMAAGHHVSAEDSFGESTFEILDLHDIYPDVIDFLGARLQQLEPDLAEQATEVLDIARRDSSFELSDARQVAFLGEMVEAPSHEVLGTALAEVGLLPDSTIGSLRGDDLRVRLERNRQQMAILTEGIPPAERVRALPIDRSKPAGKRLASEILSELEDGTQDAVVLARRLAVPALREKVDFDRWQLGDAKASLEELRVLQLIGDVTGGAVPRVERANASVGVKFRIRPAAGLVAGLKELNLELMKVGEHEGDLSPAGKDATKRGKQLPHQPQSQWKLKLPQDLDEGTYRFRLRAYDEDNLLVGEGLSETFDVGELEESMPSTHPTSTLAAARVAAQAEAGPDARVEWPPSLTAKTKDLGSTTIRFNNVGTAWSMHRSPLLAQVERYVLENPETLNWNVALDSVDTLNAGVATYEPPASFLDIRRDVFEQLVARQFPVESERSVGPSVAHADLMDMESSIRLYAESWGDAVRAARTKAELRELLAVDQVSVTNTPGGVEARLVGPTHPLRLLWQAHYVQTIDRWLTTSAGSDGEVSELAVLIPSLVPSNIPHVIPGSAGVLRHVDSLDAYWGLWGSTTQADAGGLAGWVKRSLGFDGAGASGFKADEVVRRIRRYLVAHPYVNVLTLNFVQPGSARLVLDTLLTLQNDTVTQDLRYVVRLFSKGITRWEIGSALDEFMADPEAGRVYKREAVDAFVASNDDPLAPKLTYSKHDLEDLLHSPDRFPAHVTFFLDWFDLEVVPSPPLAGRRSIFASDLIVEPAVAFRSGEDRSSPVWDQQVAMDSKTPDLFRQVYSAAEQGAAKIIGADAPGLVPSVRLTLDRVRRSIFDAVHRNSDWVVTIDPVFTDEFLDIPPKPGETSRYLVDYVEPSVLESTRRIMVSTRSRSELARLFDPIANKYGLTVGGDRIAALLEALQVLGAGLPLKLLNNRTQALEALTLALGSLFLVDRGIFRHGFVLPLDAHQSLFREAMDWRTEAGTDLRRTDLAIIRPDPARRKFGIHLVELKARGSLPASLPPDLVDQIAAQLENTRSVLRNRLFGAELRKQPGSLSSDLQARRLMQIMTRYLERNIRFGFVPEADVEVIRRFLTTLDDEYTISFDKQAIVFDFEGEESSTALIDGIQFWRIGRDQIDGMLANASTQLATRPIPMTDSQILEPAGLETRLERVPGVEKVSAVEDEESESEPEESGEEETLPAASDDSTESEASTDSVREEVMLIGTAASSKQFGIIGRQSGTGRAVAIDLDETNVISVFGLQGAGKSYTVGTLLEACVIPGHHLNELRKPLAGVVFHYSTDRRYKPEFVSMRHANTDVPAIEMLSRDYDTTPDRVPDLVVLAPPDVVAERQAEFPDVVVQPLLIGPQELTVDDWRLLMGLDGGDQMYARVLNAIFKQLRSSITIATLKEAVEASKLNSSQKNLALMRIEFVEGFVEDGAHVASYIRPGRIVVVDLRDPYTEEDQALRLFMVLLERFGEVEDDGSGSFNKYVVFDEAHKYMGNEALTSAIVASGRLTRHSGTSIVMASQDPPSVPKKVVELSTIIVSHRMTSPQWLDHLRKANEAFAGSSMRISMLAQLNSGEAFVWSRDGDPAFRRPQKVRMRPRLTLHGGATRRATD
jgi:DNA phosphorothioation-dependent restriction protein DptH